MLSLLQYSWIIYFHNIKFILSVIRMNCTASIQENQLITILNSGKSLTQIGFVQQCLTYGQMKYGLLRFFNKTINLPIGIDMGLCLPKTCQALQIQKLANQKFENLKYPVFTKFIDSPQEFNPEFNWAFYFSLALLSLIVLIVIVSTAFTKLSKKNHIIGSFSLRSSLQVFNYKEHKFNVFNGIKSLCMMWVIVGHMYSVRIQNNINQLTITDQVQVPSFLIFLSAFFAVDVFFYIGGFLVAYSFLRNSMKSVMKYPLAIAHRLLRFWPSYIMAMLIYYGVMIHTGSGPLWSKLYAAGQFQYCSTLWKPILFVDNIVDNGQKMCMGWGWYLQNDMQIFIFSIPILFLYSRNRKISYLIIQLLIVFSLIYNFMQVQLNQYITIAHRADFVKWSTYFPNVYIKPWTRCPPYLYGLTLGLLYMEFIQQQKNNQEKKGIFSKIKQQLQKSRILKNSIQLLAIFIILFIVFIPRTLQVGHKWPQIVHSFYLTLTKLFFVMAVSMLATPSLLGIKNDLFFFMMDTKLFNFIAKISFWTYLIHYMVIEHACYTQKIDYYYKVGDIFTLYFPVALIAMAFGLVGTVLVEVPFGKLQKMLFESKKKSKKSEEQDIKIQATLSASVMSGTSDTDSNSTFLSSSKLGSVVLNKESYLGESLLSKQ